jgi:hypothetical protein
MTDDHANTSKQKVALSDTALFGGMIHLRTHGQTTGKVENLARARGYGKVRRDFSCADPVAETALHECHAGSHCVLQELPDLSIVNERRNAQQKTPGGRSFRGRTFYSVL